MSQMRIQRALISVSDKTGLVPFAKELHQLGIELISTGGTSHVLREAGIPVLDVASVTGFPEIMDGRVKTLHPKIHGGILGRRDIHADIAKQHNIPWIDLVIVNLYPFAKVSQDKQATVDEVIENIDIGGPTMIRSAAKNFAFVTTVVDPKDYASVVAQLKENQSISDHGRRCLAQKAFAHTAQYDTLIQQYLAGINGEESLFPAQQLLSITKERELRYGENPHQKACVYRLDQQSSSMLDAVQHQGKVLSYNNLVDASAAMACVQSFESPACAIIKHANPCGVAVADSPFHAFTNAHAADQTSAFGGIIALNCPCDETTAASIITSFFEVIIAPEFSTDALAQFAKKPNLIVLSTQNKHAAQSYHYQLMDGFVLAQEKDVAVVDANQLHVVTQKKPSPTDLADLSFAWQIVKQVKSNAIVVAKAAQTLGIGAGQVSRIDAVNIAIQKAGEKATQAVLASDAFFPFKDNIEQIAAAGIRAIIQPGGSIRDEEVIKACDDAGIAMVFTGIRCFKH